VDAGDPNQCTHKLIENQDQRGEARPKDGDANGSEICDIGAFENDVLKAGYGSTPVQPGPVNLGAAIFGNPTNGSFSIFETGNYTLTVSSAALSGGAASQFSIVSSTPLNILDGNPAVDFDLSLHHDRPNRGAKSHHPDAANHDPDNAA
jgi:hypothetical protein